MKSKDQAKDLAVNPLVVNGRKLVPSVTRVFSASRPMHIFLQAYQPAPPSSSSTPQVALGAHPYVAFVTLFREQKKVFETTPIAVNPLPNTRLGITPLSFELTPKGLPPGDYNCEVSVVDPSGKKATFWQAPIEVVP